MEEGERRPDPDALLRRVKEEEERRSRAKLKIFFGFAPGVGKTYAMLEDARRLRAEGVDVVVGLVETHGRRETEALLEGLEVLPRKVICYRGRELEELDLDAALARKPQVLLVDELAHTNAPGSRHEKRWQDVLELLDAGMGVHTTLNVQHLESLNDVIAQLTSIHVRETVPDALLDRGDEIELVDITPEQLLERLREGKVYVPEQATRALEHFFQRGHLLALRELALRRTAERVDRDVRAYREEHAIEETWPAAERVLVSVGPGPGSARLVRAGRRVAAGLRAPWVAAAVETTSAAPLSQNARTRLESHLRLAEALGAEVVRLVGSKVSDALLDYARRHNVTRIILGKPTHSPIKDILHGSLVAEIIRGSGDIDVHLIHGDDVPARQEPDESRRKDFVLRPYAASALLVALATVGAALWQYVFELPDTAILYLLAVVVAAVRFGRGPALVGAILSVAAYDFWFLPPHFTFAVAHVKYLPSFGVFIAVSLLVSTLTLQVHRRERAEREREQRMATLLALSREVCLLLGKRELCAVIARRASEAFDCGAAVHVPDDDGGFVVAATAGPIALDAQESGVARWVFEHGRPAGLGTDTLPGARVTCFPLRCGPSALGALAISPRDAKTLGGERRDFVDAFVRQTALALERARLADQADNSALRACREELETAAPAIRRLAVSMRDIVEAARMRASDKLAGRSLTLDLDDAPSVTGDATLLEQAVANVLENAAENTPAGGTIEVRAFRRGPSAILEIADRGPGLAPGDESRIFTPGCAKLARAGERLGLPLAKRIVEAHGGALFAENRPGGGATLCVVLPVAPASPRLEGRPRRGEAPPRPAPSISGR